MYEYYYFIAAFQSTLGKNIFFIQYIQMRKSHLCMDLILMLDAIVGLE